jgi:hypothetical protein
MTQRAREAHKVIYHREAPKAIYGREAQKSHLWPQTH